jgi:site-specific DNA-methyltransferase (adenine-specific)
MGNIVGGSDSGRWPANVIHDGSDEVVALFPQEAGAAAQASGPQQAGPAMNQIYGHFKGMGERPAAFHADTGSAARFFYTSKASREDRNDGLHHRAARAELIGAAGHKINPMTGRPVVDVPRANHHPTVKPVDLMRYLCRLVTPPGGTVLDPFCGSGSTGKAALLEGFDFIGIELDAEYVAIAKDRVYAAAPLFASEA